ncbi:pal [Symbiodinium sp. CCMP2592]|nr:pal [Symbiodinium sp. CCMP2592]
MAEMSQQPKTGAGGLEPLPVQRLPLELLRSDAARVEGSKSPLPSLRSARLTARQRLSRDLEDLRPKLESAKARAEELAQVASAKRSELATLAKRRTEAAEQLGSLSRRQLSEIRQLCRSPPDSVKRTLAAVWLFLNASRFQGKSPASFFDDRKDWSKCQRMLADDAFIGRILNYDTAILTSVPHVMSHVAGTYLGISADRRPSDSSDSSCTRPDATSQEPETSDGAAFGGRMASRATLRRTLTKELQIREMMASKGVPLPPLDLPTVARASEPCGRLLLWMTRVLEEVGLRAQLEAELQACESELDLVERQRASFEMEVACAERAMAPPLPKVEAPKEERRSPRKPLREVVLNPLPISAMAPLPLPAKPTPKAEAKVPIELDVTGQLASVHSQLAKLKMTFPKGVHEISACGTELECLDRMCDMLREHRDGRLKLSIEGHSQANESDGLDLQRARGAMQELKDNGISAGLLRVVGRGCESNDGAGTRMVVAKPLHELVPLYGPIAPEAAAARAPVGLYFEAQLSKPGKEAALILEAMAEWLKSDKTFSEVVIEGHCDRLEPQAPQLSLSRANAVRDVLTQLGVASSKLRVQGFGSEHPLSLANRACNRRAEVHLRGKRAG